MPTVYRGTIVHTKSFDEFESFEQGFVAVQDGKVGIDTDLLYDYNQVLDLF